MSLHATIRRYEAADQARTSEILKNAEENLVPRLSELSGFKGYYLIKAPDGVFSSVGFFDTAAHADNRRVRLGARAEARDRPPEPAEDHQRRSRRLHGT
jgi:hypothetical protein